MEEKSIETKQEEPTAKKVYTPPTLSVYGKLTELTAAGTAQDREQNKHDFVNRL